MDTRRSHADHLHFSPVQIALDKTANIGTYECQLFRKRIFEKSDLLAVPLASNYCAINKRFGYLKANSNLYHLDKRLKIHDFNISSSTEEVTNFAHKQASICRKFKASKNATEKDILNKCLKLAFLYRVKPKEEANDFYEVSLINRFCCHKWWRQKLLILRNRQIESIARDIGLVNKFKNAYSSYIAQNARNLQKSKTLHYLETTFLENSEGQSFCLKDLYDTSISNPKNRRAELMTRISGFEIVAEQLGDIGEFYTITAPSKMHSRLSRNGASNSKYDGSTPNDVNDYLQITWQRIRAKFNRDGIHVYGFRVAEPNHDGTPHWHLLLFMRPSDKPKVRQIFKRYCLQLDGNEKGAKKHRFKAIPIDKKQGSAAGYIAKYIAKNIDGSHIDKDTYGNDSKSSAKAIDAWASIWGIRQFQQIGGPSVTVWRELRRLSQNNESTNNDLLDKAISHATAADWAAYVMIMGGPRLSRSKHPIQPLYQTSDFINYDTGELFEDCLTEYGDPAAPKIKGLLVNDEEFITRQQTWLILKSSVH